MLNNLIDDFYFNLVQKGHFQDLEQDSELQEHEEGLQEILENIDLDSETKFEISNHTTSITTRMEELAFKKGLKMGMQAMKELDEKEPAAAKSN